MILFSRFIFKKIFFKDVEKMNKSLSRFINILVWVSLILCGISFLIFHVFRVYEKRSTNHEGIPIAMALDDGYTYPTIVAMTSILENAAKETKYDFYIMHPGEFSEENKGKLKSLSKKYRNKCSVNLINMENKYKNANDKGHITTPTYYRLSLSELLPDLDKIIWLDGDTITYTDLKEMYDIDMEGYYYKGFLDDNVAAVDSFTTENDHCICAGVMLINLKELRQDDMVNKFSDFIEKNNEKLVQHDQTTINAMCYKKIGILPPKFGVYNYSSVEEAKSQAGKYRLKNGYTEADLEQAYNNPAVLHCISKPWKNINVRGGRAWWEYARKTDYYSEIQEKYGATVLAGN